MPEKTPDMTVDTALDATAAVTPVSTPLFYDTARTIAEQQRTRTNAAEAEQRVRDHTSPADSDFSLAEGIHWIDPDSPEGIQILRLLRRLHDIEQDGRWPAEAVVEELTAWFTKLGIDPAASPADVRAALLAEPCPWTVFALRATEAPHDTTVTAVLCGQVTCHDADSDKPGYQRLRAFPTATTATEAKQQALRAFAEPDEP